LLDLCLVFIICVRVHPCIVFSVGIIEENRKEAMEDLECEQRRDGKEENDPITIVWSSVFLVLHLVWIRNVLFGWNMCTM